MLQSTHQLGDYTAEIWLDTDPLDPTKEYDMFGTMACWHRRYNLGHEQVTNLDFLDDSYIHVPIYIYDHGNISIRPVPFNCVWDSGQVGVIYVSKVYVKKEFNWERLTRKRIDKIREILKDEIAAYDMYLSGQAYGYKIFKDGEEIDSCWSILDTHYNILEELKKEYLTA